MTEGDVDYVTFKYIKWSNKPGPGPGAAGDIILYMPNSTPSISNNQDWGESKARGALGKMVRDFAVTATKGIDAMGDGEKVGQSIDKLKNDIGNGLKNGGAALKQAGIQGVANIAGQQPNQLLALADGKIFNPNIELLYAGPKLRGFSFDYTFVPKTPAEAAEVGKIIKTFKIYSSPKQLENGMYEVPYTWQVSYMTGGGLNKNMNCFKRAALTNIATQANPGLPMHASFIDGMPVITQLQLTFMETEIVTRKDQEEAPSNFGY